MTLQAAHSASEDEPTAARSESDDDDDLTRLMAGFTASVPDLKISPKVLALMTKAGQVVRLRGWRHYALEDCTRAVLKRHS